MPGKDKRPYRKGVGAVLFNGRGKVFAAKRIDTPGQAWQLPQGGIDKGEKPRQAVLRELAEETGVVKAEIIAKSREWLSYDLPGDIAAKIWKGRYRGQKQKWFALRFTGKDEDIDLNAAPHAEFSAWKWVDLEALPAMIVPFKRELYEAVVEEFKHLAENSKNDPQ